jgi:hypothetical protein
MSGQLLIWWCLVRKGNRAGLVRSRQGQRETRNVLPVLAVRMRRKTAKTQRPSSLFLVEEKTHIVRGGVHLHYQAVRIQLVQVLKYYQNSFWVLAGVPAKVPYATNLNA